MVFGTGGRQNRVAARQSILLCAPVGRLPFGVPAQGKFLHGKN